MGCMVEHAEFLAEELLTLHISNDTTANTLERSSNPTLKRNEYPDAPQYTRNIQPEIDTGAKTVQFGETLYVTDEEGTYQSQIENEFANETFNTSYHSGEVHHTHIIDCSNIHLSTQYSTPNSLAFCFDIGAIDQF